MTSRADVAQRSGIDKARLSRLENAKFPNVTIDTVERYAEALGKQVVVGLADATGR
jgi:transcriptional regulator with XRE-family HTH domain